MYRNPENSQLRYNYFLFFSLLFTGRTGLGRSIREKCS